MIHALGEYAGVSSEEIFDTKNGSRSPELLKTFGKRLVALPEFGEDTRPANDMFKRLASEDMISVRDNHAKASSIIEARPTALFVGATNSPPGMRNVDTATRRRICAIPFEVSVLDDNAESDNYKADALKEHGREAMIAWAVEGWNLYIKDGIAQSSWPEAVVENTKKFIDDMVPSADFLNECIEVTGDENHWIIPAEAYAEYQAWAQSQGIQERDIKPQKAFSAEIGRSIGTARNKQIIVNGEKKIMRVFVGCRIIPVGKRGSVNPFKSVDGKFKMKSKDDVDGDDGDAGTGTDGTEEK